MGKTYNIKLDERGKFVPDIMNDILKERGIRAKKQFLNPTKKSLLPLDSLPSIEKAANIVQNGILKDKLFKVLFDCDLDGISAGTIITRYLKNFNANIETHINHNKLHGIQNVNELRDCDVLIVVDSLDSEIDNYKVLSESGIEVIVLDHHAVNPEVPYDKYITLVTSQTTYENKALSGAGVTWKFCRYIDDCQGTDFSNDLLDLCACGLIADMVDMKNMENRYLVSKGLCNLKNPALKKIIGSYEFNATSITYSVAPIVNAANRIDQNETAMQAFLEDENKNVLSCMRVLKKCKEIQNKEVEFMMDKIIEQCESQMDKKMIVVFIDTKYGVSGLIGNKLLEKYQRPVLVLKVGDDEEDFYRGSMRAVGLDDFRKICNDSGLARAEGHELAAGFVIAKKNLDTFRDYVEDKLINIEINLSISADIRINLEDLTFELVEAIHKLDKISGEGFAPIKVYVDGIEDYEISTMSDGKHLVIRPNEYVDIIKWNNIRDISEFEEASLFGNELRVVGTLSSASFGKPKVQLILSDIDVVGE